MAATYQVYYDWWESKYMNGGYLGWVFGCWDDDASVHTMRKSYIGLDGSIQNWGTETLSDTSPLSQGQYVYRSYSDGKTYSEYNSSTSTFGGEELDPVTLEPIDNRTEGQIAFDELKEKNGWTTEQTQFALNCLAALIIGGAAAVPATATVLGLGIANLGVSLGLHTAVFSALLTPFPDLPTKIMDKVSTTFDGSPEDDIPVNVVNTGTDIEKFVEDFKKKEAAAAVSDIFLGDTSLSYGVELAKTYSVPSGDVSAVSSDISAFISQVYNNSVSMKTDITDNIEKKVVSFEDYYNNFKADLETYAFNNQASKDILAAEISSRNSLSETVDKVFKDDTGSVSSGRIQESLNPIKGVIQEGINQGIGDGTVNISKGGDNVDVIVNFDTAAIVGSLDTINQTIIDKPVPSTKYQEQTASIVAFENHGYTKDVNGNLVKTAEGIRDKEGQVADYRKDVEFDPTVVRTHTLADGSTVEIKKGYKQNIVASKVAEKNLEQHYREEGKNEADIILNDEADYNSIPADEKLIEKLILQDGELTDKDLFFLKYINALRVAQGLPEIVYDQSKDNAVISSVIVDPSLMNTSDPI